MEEKNNDRRIMTIGDVLNILKQKSQHQSKKPMRFSEKIDEWLEKGRNLKRSKIKK